MRYNIPHAHPFPLEKKKIITFRFDANHKKGMGHLFRMKALAGEFKKNNFDCVFVLRENKIAKDIMDEAGFNYLFFPLMFPDEEIIEEYFLKNPIPDLWIFDILSTENKLISNVKKKRVPVVCFDDLKGGLFSADLVINAISGCHQSHYSSEGLPPRILNGPRYVIIDSHILESRKKRELTKKRTKVGVTMGGSDTHGATVKIGQVLSKIKGIDIHVTFFLGPHFLHHSELRQMASTFSFPYSVKNAIHNFHTELGKMDIVICGGGQTLFELCAMGMPVLALANEKHEEKTIDFFSRKGACVSIGSVHTMIDTEKIAQFFLTLRSEPGGIFQMMANAQKLVDGKGMLRCYRECVGLIERIG